ncbi:MAG: hypothetical protein M1838_003747 [Thelocarpon superellum]|nr:MAG: hypothetical protein M1838_003747 [Thelocarpon superellum]
MAAATRRRSVPGTPRVISPSPTLSEGPSDGSDGYFGPVTRSARKPKAPAPPPLIDENPEDEDEDEDLYENGKGDGASDSSFELTRARTRSRSPAKDSNGYGPGTTTLRRLSGLSPAKPASTAMAVKTSPRKATKKKPSASIVANGSSSKISNGHLSPASASPTSRSTYWRDLSRSPSPLGLIPIHRHWRSLIHRHEIPRKLLHVSIGFVTLYLYTAGVQASHITPYLMGGLIPIASIDYLRHRYAGLNQAYVRVCGMLMRESEVEGWNGVIWYLLGAYVALRFFPKDVGVMSVLLLSWCDTAASTLGRAYGRYTPRLRRGKSLAGTLAALLVGAGSAAVFWGLIVPSTGIPTVGRADPANNFMFTGSLHLPSFPFLSSRSSLPSTTTTTFTPAATGPLALGIISFVTGLVGAASEVVNLWGADDNLTIPVLSALGLWAFLKVFG